MNRSSSLDNHRQENSRAASVD
uniref:Uncharacterized protein n=1 Tax=Arundo donax TaxID=35708 RepID=A0A0A9GTY8_ARUDO